MVFGIRKFHNVFVGCGQRMDDTHKLFIVNGQLSKFGDFPWHVGIYKIKNNQSEPSYICGGSIITEKAILTVAHCFTNAHGSRNVAEYYVAAGKYYSSYNSPKDEYAQKRKAYRIEIHPSYKGIHTSYRWDIAVVIVDTPFEISTLVQPVCVDWTTDFENEQLVPNNYGEVAGWGATELNVLKRADELRVLKVPYIREDECTKSVPDTFIRFITSDKFCAGYTNGSSICDGDSGSGLVFQRHFHQDKRFYIRGLVSLGLKTDGHCDKYKYSTYTKVSQHLQFIQKIIEYQYTQHVPDDYISKTYDSCKTPHDEYGTCVSIYECQIFLDVMQNNPTPEEQNFIRKSICKYNEEELFVCCGSLENYLSMNSNPVTIKPLGYHKNLFLLPENCGQQTRIRQVIFSDNVTTLLDLSWLTKIEYRAHADREFRLLCGGTLINQQYILTTGHCLHRIEGKFRVGLGNYDTSTQIDSTNSSTGNLSNGTTCTDPPLYVDIEEIIEHPFYAHNDDLNEPKNDIALVRLAEPVVFTNCIKPICLPLNGERSPPGRQMVLSQWELTEDINIKDFIKKKDFVKVIPNDKCANILNDNLHKTELKDSHICVRDTKKRDACQIFNTTSVSLTATLPNSSNVYVEGLITFKYCGPEGTVRVVTRVSDYIQWILDNIKM